MTPLAGTGARPHSRCTRKQREDFHRLSICHFFFPLLLLLSLSPLSAQLGSARLTDWDCGSRGREEYVPSLSGLAVNLCGYWCGIPSASSDGREEGRGGRNVCGRHVCSLGSAAVSGGSADINRWIVWQSCALVGRLAERPGCGRVCVTVYIYVCVCVCVCVCVYGVCFWLPSPTSRCRSAHSGRGQDMNVMRGSLQRKQTGSSFRGREREIKGGTCSPEFTPGEPHPPWGPPHTCDRRI